MEKFYHLEARSLMNRVTLHYYKINCFDPLYRNDLSLETEVPLNMCLSNTLKQQLFRHYCVI